MLSVVMRVVVIVMVVVSSLHAAQPPTEKPQSIKPAPKPAPKTSAGGAQQSQSNVIEAYANAIKASPTGFANKDNINRALINTLSGQNSDDLKQYPSDEQAKYFLLIPSVADAWCQRFVRFVVAGKLQIKDWAPVRQIPGFENNVILRLWDEVMVQKGYKGEDNLPAVAEIEILGAYANAIKKTPTGFANTNRVLIDKLLRYDSEALKKIPSDEKAKYLLMIPSVAHAWCELFVLWQEAEKLQIEDWAPVRKIPGFANNVILRLWDEVMVQKGLANLAAVSESLLTQRKLQDILGSLDDQDPNNNDMINSIALHFSRENALFEQVVETLLGKQRRSEQSFVDLFPNGPLVYYAPVVRDYLKKQQNNVYIVGAQLQEAIKQTYFKKFSGELLPVIKRLQTNLFLAVVESVISSSPQGQDSVDILVENKHRLDGFLEVDFKRANMSDEAKKFLLYLMLDDAVDNEDDPQKNEACFGRAAKLVEKMEESDRDDLLYKHFSDRRRLSRSNMIEISNIYQKIFNKIESTPNNQPWWLVGQNKKLRLYKLLTDLFLQESQAQNNKAVLDEIGGMSSAADRQILGEVLKKYYKDSQQAHQRGLFPVMPEVDKVYYDLFKWLTNPEIQQAMLNLSVSVSGSTQREHYIVFERLLNDKNSTVNRALLDNFFTTFFQESLPKLTSINLITDYLESIQQSDENFAPYYILFDLLSIDDLHEHAHEWFHAKVWRSSTVCCSWYDSHLDTSFNIKAAYESLVRTQGLVDTNLLRPAPIITKSFETGAQWFKYELQKLEDSDFWTLFKRRAALTLPVLAKIKQPPAYDIQKICCITHQEFQTKEFGTSDDRGNLVQFQKRLLTLISAMNQCLVGKPTIFREWLYELQALYIMGSIHLQTLRWNQKVDYSTEMNNPKNRQTMVHIMRFFDFIHRMDWSGNNFYTLLSRTSPSGALEGRSFKKEMLDALVQAIDR